MKIKRENVNMSPLELEKLKKIKQIEAIDIYYRKKALNQARHFFTKDALLAPKCMQTIWLKKHNELFRKLLNDPLYDARCFFAVKERD